MVFEIRCCLFFTIIDEVDSGGSRAKTNPHSRQQSNTKNGMVCGVICVLLYFYVFVFGVIW